VVNPTAIPNAQGDEVKGKRRRGGGGERWRGGASQIGGSADRGERRGKSLGMEN